MKKDDTNEKHKFLWLKIILIFAAVLTALITWALSPYFNITYVKVEGAHHYSNETIRGMSEISEGTNGFRMIGLNPLGLFTLSFKDVERRIADRCPYISDVDVDFLLPSTASIVVKERKPAFIVNDSGTRFIIDDQLYVLEILKNEAEKGLPMIQGLLYDNYSIGEEIKLKNKNSFTNALILMKAVYSADDEDSNALSKWITYIDISSNSKTMIFLDNRIMVNFGGMEEINYKISLLKTIYFQNLSEKDFGLLDFTAGENPIFSPESGR